MTLGQSATAEQLIDQLCEGKSLDDLFKEYKGVSKKGSIYTFKSTAVGERFGIDAKKLGYKVSYLDFKSKPQSEPSRIVTAVKAGS